MCQRIACRDCGLGARELVRPVTTLVTQLSVRTRRVRPRSSPAGVRALRAAPESRADVQGRSFQTSEKLPRRYVSIDSSASTSRKCRALAWLRSDVTKSAEPHAAGCSTAGPHLATAAGPCARSTTERPHGRAHATHVMATGASRGGKDHSCGTSGYSRCKPTE